MRHAIRSVVLTGALVILLAVPAGVASADVTTWKATHDTDPHLPLTSEQLRMTAEKRAAESQIDTASPIADPFSTCGTSCGGGGLPSSASLVANQTPQTT